MSSGSARAFVDWLDAEAETFSNATTREHYLNYSGLKDSLRLTPIFRKHARLFHRDTVERAVSLNSRDPRLGHLREFVIDGYLEQAAKTLTEEIAERETSDVVRVGRKDVPYRSVSQMIINEGDAAKRHALDELRAEVTTTQNDLRERRWDLLYKQTRDLGYKDYLDLCDQTGGLHLEDLRVMLERFLWETDQAYREQLSKQLGNEATYRDCSVPRSSTLRSLASDWSRRSRRRCVAWESMSTTSPTSTWTRMSARRSRRGRFALLPTSRARSIS
jgi:hypothetical protein